MLFTLRKNSEDYNIKERLNNIKLMLEQIEDLYNSNHSNTSNMLIDAYLHSAEYILHILIKNINDSSSNNAETKPCFSDSKNKFV